MKLTFGLAKELKDRQTKEFENGQSYPDEIPPSELPTLPEGAKRTVVVNGYERNPRARRICLDHYGSGCNICALDFGATYGELGEGYIHVHHLRPLSTVGEEYELGPIADLRPVCPNCHAMLHRPKELMSIEDLREVLKGERRKWSEASAKLK